MPRRLTIAPLAARQMDQAQTWLLQPGSGAAGARRWQAIRMATETLLANPHLGKINSEQQKYRQLVISGYRMIYRIDPDTGDKTTAGDISILQLFGPGRE